MAADNHTACPLCGRQAPEPFFEDHQRAYLRCTQCRLVFVPSADWLSPAEEKAVYDRHRNDPDDAGYRSFLSRLGAPLLEKLPPKQKGLDFGCGPGPALARMLTEHGHQVSLYDPFYFRDRAVLTAAYDFITATEVVEHLRHPGRVFVDLFGMLRPGGWLGVMTKLVIDREAFRSWHYIRDPTHISFFSRDTFEYIALRFNAAVEFVGRDVVLLHKRS